MQMMLFLIPFNLELNTVAVVLK